MNPPINLQARGCTNPLALGPGPVELSWASVSGDGHTRIQASRSTNFDLDHLVWESPWHADVPLVYDGPRPEPLERIYWRVGSREGDVTAWSDPAWFEAAPDMDDWRGEWIFGAVMRHEFDIPGVPIRARLSVFAQDRVLFIIDGEVVTVEKGPTLQSVDISDLLAEGGNEIVVEAGRPVAFQIDGRLDTTLDFGVHSDLDWLPEGGESRVVSASERLLR